MKKRVFASIVLVLGAIGAGVHYAAVEDDHWQYPTATAVYQDYDAHVGDEVLLFGRVTAVGPDGDTADLRVPTDAGILDVSVDRARNRLATGAFVQVHGEVRPDREVAAHSVVTVEPTPRSRTFKYVVSAVGALVALGAFFRSWRLDVGSMTFVPR